MDPREIIFFEAFNIFLTRRHLQRSLIVIARWEIVLLKLERRQETIEICNYIAITPQGEVEEITFSGEQIASVLQAYYVLSSRNVIAFLRPEILRRSRNPANFLIKFTRRVKRDVVSLVLTKAHFVGYAEEVRSDFQADPSSIIGHHKTLLKLLPLASLVGRSQRDFPGVARVLARRQGVAFSDPRGIFFTG